MNLLGGRHEVISDALARLTGAVADAVGVQNTHGPIADAVHRALSSVLGSRDTTIQKTAASSSTISELLRKAAELYEKGDVEGAQRLRAAAATLAGDHGGEPRGPGGAPAAGTPAAGTAAPAAPAADVAGQVAGQVGQLGAQVGQLGNQLGSSMAGLSQGLQQLPQQIMQGVQQATQAAQAGRMQQMQERMLRERPQ
ncbi:hypothetical protein C731_3248, partial [Mycolicibacterium hassiacum DSM 44199]